MKYKVNNGKSEQPDMEYLVLKNFIAVLKKHGMYSMFRGVVGISTNNIVSSMYQRMSSFSGIIRNQSNDNIFKDANDIGSCVKMMRDSFNGGVGNEKDPAKIQHHIANCVNLLLHVFVERSLRDFQKLQDLGAEVFDMSCREIFGGEFQDMLPEPDADVMEKMKVVNNMLLNGQKPTQEMLDELNRIIHQSRMEQNDLYQDSDDMDGDIDDLDEFLDNFDDWDTYNESDDTFEDDDEVFDEGDEEGFEEGEEDLNNEGFSFDERIWD